jgi:hypothetical protein
MKGGGGKSFSASGWISSSSGSPQQGTTLLSAASLLSVVPHEGTVSPDSNGTPFRISELVLCESNNTGIGSQKVVTTRVT